MGVPTRTAKAAGRDGNVKEDAASRRWTSIYILCRFCSATASQLAMSSRDFASYFVNLHFSLRTVAHADRVRRRLKRKCRETASASRL